MKPNRMLLGAASALFTVQVMAGQAVFYVTEEGSAVRDLAVSVDGQKKLVSSSGFVVFDIEDGSHKVELSKFGEWMGEFEFDTTDSSQNAEVQVEMIAGEAMPDINVYTPGQEEAVALGQLSGFLQSAETGGPVAGARVSVDGTEQAVMTDEDGFFSFELPRGEYSVKVNHPNYGEQDVNSVRVMGNVNTGVNLTMSMSGDGMIEEVVAVGSYIPSTATAQERDSSAVLDAIGSEQMARFGDSNAASALKRVAGVSVVGGQFAVVRGMAGRYISSTLNGSLMPSTDPMRRDVPLDLFPSSVLGGIDIQKSFTPDMPGDSTGGAIGMTTKGVPDGPETKLTLSAGMNSRTTFSDIESYNGGETDWLGIDDGTRELPSYADSMTNGGLDNPTVCSSSTCATEADIAAIGKSFENNYNVRSVQAKPTKGFAISNGNYSENDNGGFGHYAAFQYKDEWTARHDASINDVGEDGTYERSQRKVDLAGYLALGLDSGSSSYSSKTILLRKTDDTTKVSDAVYTSYDQRQIQTTLQWVERQFLNQQFSGEHYFNLIGEDQLSWRVGASQTRRYEPDRRTYTYAVSTNSTATPSLIGSVERRYSDLTEDSIDLGVDYSSDIELDNAMLLKLKTGILVSNKSRTVDMQRYGAKIIDSSSVSSTLSPEEIFTDSNLDDYYVSITGTTTSTDSYEAEDNVYAGYLSGELDMNSVSVLAGARFESFEQSLEYPDSSKEESKLDDSFLMPVISANWRATEDSQIRASISQTISRPGITERSESASYDPETDDVLSGNPDLEVSKIVNLDLRGEYYFSDEDSMSVALFYKDITDPIERTVIDGSGSASDGYTFDNVTGATLQGLEIDFRKSVFSESEFSGFVGGNFSYIDSEVDLSGTDAERLEGESSRELQGQSKYLSNMQFGVDHLATGQSLTLLVNYFGDRIYATARGSLESEIENERTTVDLVYSYDPDEFISVKAKVENLTDSPVRYSRSDSVIEEYYEGTKINTSVTFNF
ncbi:MAG: TonB-dependent receptor [Pseudomonadota bacterium]|nr:TonB-dependent receptor [Pseudomonadota bacterium]